MRTRHLEGTIHVAADPAEVYAVVSDVTRTGEWSPVCKECWWVDGAGPQVGAWFGGRQEVPGRTWETTSLVVAADPGREFAWQVGGKYAAWSYRMRPVDGGTDLTQTELTQTWDLNDATEALFVTKYADRADATLDARTQEARDGIPVTLATLKQIIESSR